MATVPRRAFSPAQPIAACACRTGKSEWVGLPVCVGIGATKTLAKLANHCAKPEKFLGMKAAFDLNDIPDLPRATTSRPRRFAPCRALQFDQTVIRFICFTASARKSLASSRRCNTGTPFLRAVISAMIEMAISGGVLEPM